jgi:hypothetical protein
MRIFIPVAAIVTLVIIPNVANAQTLRERCAASTGARSGSAYSACVTTGISRGERTFTYGKRMRARGGTCKRDGTC